MSVWWVSATVVTRITLLGVLCLCLAACTTAAWQQLLYDAGDNYACQQAGANQPDAEARASQCGDSQHPDRSRYEDYETARKQVLNPPP
jgi:hypothetical protein